MEVIIAILVGLIIFSIPCYIFIKFPNAMLNFSLILLGLGILIIAWFVGGLVLDAVFHTDIVHTKWE